MTELITPLNDVFLTNEVLRQSLEALSTPKPQTAMSQNNNGNTINLKENE